MPVTLEPPVQAAIPRWPNADALMNRLLRDVPSWSLPREATLKAFGQFMAVCGRSTVPRAPSVAIDEVWHVALLFTRDYREFCAREFGRFIDHSPLATSGPSRIYEDTRDLADQMFGPLDSTLWPTAAESPANGNAGADCDGGGWSVYTP